jgi:hypothetical protein
LLLSMLLLLSPLSNVGCWWLRCLPQAPGVTLPPTCLLGPNVVVGPGCVIEDGQWRCCRVRRHPAWFTPLCSVVVAVCGLPRQACESSARLFSTV